MYCPACYEPLQGNVSICARCSLSLSNADQYFGIAPQLNASITDLAGVLSQKQKLNLEDQLYQMELQFPQCHFAAITCAATQQVPPGAYVFWLFNKGGLAAPIETDGDCHLLLIAIDVVTRTSICMIGYGFEPLLDQATLQRISESSRSSLEKQDYETAIEQALTQVHKELKAISEYTATGNTSPSNSPSAQTEEFAY